MMEVMKKEQKERARRLVAGLVEGLVDVPDQVVDQLLDGLIDDGLVDRLVDRLIDGAWRNIAASGWNRYQLYGRGALLASMDMLAGKSFDMNYITPSASAPLPSWLESAINGYDPQTSVVLVFVEDDVYRRTRRRGGADLLEEYMEILSGPAYLRLVVHTPPPPECARSLAH